MPAAAAAAAASSTSFVVVVVVAAVVVDDGAAALPLPWRPHFRYPPSHTTYTAYTYRTCELNSCSGAPPTMLHMLDIDHRSPLFLVNTASACYI